MECMTSAALTHDALSHASLINTLSPPFVPFIELSRENKEQTSVVDIMCWTSWLSMERYEVGFRPNHMVPDSDVFKIPAVVKYFSYPSILGGLQPNVGVMTSQDKCYH